MDFRSESIKMEDIAALNRSLECIASEKFGLALGLITDLILSNPYTEELYKLRKYCYERIEEAENYLTEHTAQKEDKEIPQSVIGNIYNLAKKGDFVEAKELCDSELQKSFLETEVISRLLLLRAKINIKINNKKSAAQDYKQHLQHELYIHEEGKKKNPRLARNFAVRAEIFCKLGCIDNAASEYNQLISKTHKSAESQFSLAMIYKNKKDAESAMFYKMYINEALTLYEKEIEKNCFFSQTWTQYAEVLVEAGKKENAVKTLSKAKALEDGFLIGGDTLPFAAIKKAKLLAQLNRREEALKEINYALKKLPCDWIDFSEYQDISEIYGILGDNINAQKYKQIAEEKIQKYDLFSSAWDADIDLDSLLKEF